MTPVSAGLLMYKRTQRGVEVLLVHPGGPYWRGKDEGVWSIPKGKVEPGEELLDAARREFEEETGVRPTGDFRPLDPVVQKSGKRVHAWAFEGSLDPGAIRSNTVTIEWPPRSGKREEFPEVDRAGFFTLEEARTKILPAQAPWLADLEGIVRSARR